MRRQELEPPIPRHWIALAAGVGLGMLLWRVAPTVLAGDTPFHLARVRKLVDLGGLSLWRMDELVDGGLHPGYAFPLWHAFLAAVSELAGVDPALVVQHESALLMPIAVVVAYEAGYALFDSAALAGVAAAAQVALVGFAAGHGGTYPLLVRPAPTARQLLVPAVLVFVIGYVRLPSARLLLTAAVASAALALVHPTYAAFLCIPLAGWLVAEFLAEPRTAWRVGAALGAVGIPTVAVSLALLPIAQATVSHEPSAVELRRSLGHYRDQLVVHGSSYHLAPGVFARSGAVAVAGLVLVPLAVLAWRRMWAALVLGGSIAVLAVMLVPFLFEHLSDALSLSQSRRAAGFVPFAFAFAGGISVLSFLIGIFVLPVALLAGAVFQALWPGDFGFRLENGGPGQVVWFAAAGGLVALLVSPLARRLSLDREGWLPGLAAALFLLPVVVHGFTRWTDRRRVGSARADAGARARAARRRAEAGRRLLRPRVELPHRRRGAGADRRRAAGARRRHEAEPPVRAAEGRARVLQERQSRDPATLRRAVARHRAHRAAPADQAAPGIQGRALQPVQDLPRESAPRHALLPAGRRRRRAAAAQIRDASTGARDRDARARARQPALGAHGPRAPAADAGVGASRPLPRPARAAAVGGAARQDGDRPRAHAGAPAPAAADPPGRGCDVEPHRDPRGAADRAHGEHRLRDHDFAAGLGASRRRRGAARARRPLDRRPARLAARAPGPPLRHRGRAPEGEDGARRRPGRRAARRRDRHGVRLDRGGDARRSRRPAAS